MQHIYIKTTENDRKLQPTECSHKRQQNNQDLLWFNQSKLHIQSTR